MKFSLLPLLLLTLFAFNHSSAQLCCPAAPSGTGVSPSVVSVANNPPTTSVTRSLAFSYESRDTIEYTVQELIDLVNSQLSPLLNDPTVYVDLYNLLVADPTFGPFLGLLGITDGPSTQAFVYGVLDNLRLGTSGGGQPTLGFIDTGPNPDTFVVDLPTFLGISGPELSQVVQIELIYDTLRLTDSSGIALTDGTITPDTAFFAGAAGVLNTNFPATQNTAIFGIDTALTNFITGCVDVTFESSAGLGDYQASLLAGVEPLIKLLQWPSAFTPAGSPPIAASGITIPPIGVAYTIPDLIDAVIGTGAFIATQLNALGTSINLDVELQSAPTNALISVSNGCGCGFCGCSFTYAFVEPLLCGAIPGGCPINVVSLLGAPLDIAGLISGLLVTQATTLQTTVDVVTNPIAIWTGDAADSDWSNCQNWNGGFVPDASTITIIPPAPLNVPNNVPTTTVTSLKVNNPLGIQFAAGAVVTADTVHFTDGVVDANGGTLVVTVGDPAAVTANATSWLRDGFLQRSVTAGPSNLFLFPVGDAVDRLMIWEPTSAYVGGLTDLTASFETANPTGAVGDFEGNAGLHFIESSANFQFDYNGGYWTLSPNAGSTTYNLDIRHNSGGAFCGGACEAFTFIKANSGVFDNGTSAATFTPPYDNLGSPIALPSDGQDINGQIQRTGYSTFSDFVLVGSPAPLPFPVELLAFDADFAGFHVDLAWTTASEVNASHFVVERSLNGQTFAEVLQKAAIGESKSRNDYLAVDTDLPVENRWFYRLKSVDNDGSFTYSPVVEVRRNDFNAIGLAVYPNPTDASLTLELTGSEVAEVTLFSPTGQVVRQLQLQGTQTLNVADLPAGVYLMQAVVGSQSFSQRIVKR